MIEGRTTELFDYDEAVRATEDAMDRVEENAPRDWLEYMLRQVRRTCLDMPIFTADEIFERAYRDPMAPATHENRAFGAVIIRATKLRYCAKADVPPQPSRRRTQHARPLTVWQSLIYRG